MYLLQQGIYWAGVLLAFYGLIVVVLNYLPAAQPLPVEFVEGVRLMFSYLRGLDFLIPMDQLFAALVVVFGYLSIVWTFEIALWILHMYRGVKA